MKKTIFITFSFMIVTLLTYSQTQSAPFKKANTILIETKLSNSDAFTKWGRHLAQNGYGIDKGDNNFYTLTTTPKDTKKFNYDFIINSTITDSGTVIINIKWRLKSNMVVQTGETQFYDWEYATGKNNIQNIIYEDLILTIKSFGNYSIRFKKR